MSEFVVDRIKPLLTSVVVQADSEHEAIEVAMDVWADDARNADAYTAYQRGESHATRQER